MTRERSAPRTPWTNPIVGKDRPAHWPEEAIEGKPLPDMAQQQFKDEVNINKIVAKYKKTKNAEILNQAQKYFADTTNLPKDYATALRQLDEAQQQFEALPAKIRKEFDHDPGQLLAFMKDPKNKGRAIELGLAQAEPSRPTMNPHKTPGKAEAPGGVPEQPKA